MTMLAVKRVSRYPMGFPSRITWAPVRIRGVRPVGVAGRDDAFPVDGGMEGILAAEQAVEAEPYVPRPLDGLALVGRSVEAVEEQDQITSHRVWSLPTCWMCRLAVPRADHPSPRSL